jgi:hypothetical protein
VAKTLTPTVKGKTVELGWSAEVRQALEMYRNALEAKKEADKAKAEAEVILREKLGDAEFATIGGSKAFKMSGHYGKSGQRKVVSRVPSSPRRSSG